MLSFSIPTNKDDLLNHEAGQFYVEEILSARLIPIKLQDARNKLIREDGITIFDHFEVLFSVVCKFNELDASVKLLTWNLLVKSCERFCSRLHKALEEESSQMPLWESSEVSTYLNALKMHVYLLVQMSELYQSSSQQNSASNAMVSPIKSKRKTKSKSTAGHLGIEWEKECAKAFHILMNFVDLDIHRLWKAQLVEDEFTSLITSFCYKVLEDQSIMKCKSVRTNVFHLLGCVIKKHNQSLSSSLKIVQMMQHFEHISGPLAEAMELWVGTYKCKSLVPEILRELSNIDEKDLVRDNVSTRTICSFLQELGKLLPAEILPYISLLLSRMDEEPYPMRNTVLGIFGEILVQCLNGETLNEKAKSDRDQFLDILYDHANLDCNAFVRSKAVQILNSLVKAEALPMKRGSKILDLGVRLLMDKSNLVRKASIQLLVELLRWNPFAGTLSIGALKEKLEEATVKLNELRLQDEQQINSSEETQTNEDEEQNQSNADENNSSQPILPPTPPSPAEDSETAKQQKIYAFLSDAVLFVEKFHEAVPILCHLLRSLTQTDVLEAINFFTVAWEFKLEFAMQGITDMLDQIWHEDQKVRDAVVYAYKEFYFKPSSDSQSPIQQVVDNMVHLAAGATDDKLQAVEALICEMNKACDIAGGVPQELWSRFVDPPSSFTMSHGISEAKQRKVIVQLLGMFAKSDPQFLRSKIGVLVDVGLAEGEVPTTKEADFVLATNTCNTLLQLSQKKIKAGTYAKQFRLPNENKIFQSVLELVVKGFSKQSSTWINFSYSALSVIFQLAAKPALMATNLFRQLQTIFDEHFNDADRKPEVSDRLLARFFSFCGHMALKLLIFIDGDVQSEIKRRRKLEEEKEEASKKKTKSKRKSKTPSRDKGDNLEEEMGVGGATADDLDQEMIKNVLETEIVGPNTLLGSVTELLVRECSLNQDNQGSALVQSSAATALAKYMLVSSEFCEKHLRLFFTMLQSSKHDYIRANLTIAAGDLCVRFPNLLEPWTANLYARLSDSSMLVRIYAIKVLTNLILNDMIKVKGHVSEMAKCIADENQRISTLAKRFFQELSKKGNAVYNVMPDVISRLSDPEVGLNDDVDFKLIMKFLFDFIQKDKQSESLVEKLCHRFKATREVQQWRDLAYCLSLLNYSEKAVKKLTENFSFYSEALRDEQVYYSFDTIISKSKKFAKPELKVQIDELEGKLLDRHTRGVDEEESAARAAEASRKHILPRSQSVSQPPVGNKRLMASTRKSSRKKRRESLSEDEGAEARSPSLRKTPTRRGNRKRVEFSSDDEDLEDGIKENGVECFEDNENEDPDLNLSQISNVSTPIRRKKTPKKVGSKSSLRV